MTRSPTPNLPRSTAAPADMRHPRLRPGLVILRRPGSVQLGWDDPDAVVLSPGSAALADWLTLLDGSRSRTELLRAAHRLGLTTAEVTTVLDRLDRRGLLEPADGRPAPTGHVRLIGAGRLGRAVAELLMSAELATLELVDDEPVDRTLYPRRLTSSRQSAALEAELQAVRSPARPGPAVCVDSSRRTGGDLPRGDLTRGDLTRGDLTQGDLSGAAMPDAPWSADGEFRRGRPDATIIASDRLEVDRMITDRLLRDDQPHLIVRAGGDGVVVGPFVLPGRTACVRCTDLARAERDPDWPVLLSQLTRTMGRTPGTLLGWAAATAVGELLGLLAGGGPPETAGRTLELRRNHRRQVRRWSAHPGCGCGWSAGALLAG